MIGGLVVACAIIAGVAYAASRGGGGDGGGGIDTGKLKRAATASGCVYRAFREEGREHVTKKLTAADYKTNPPTSGAHLPPGQEAQDGLYVAGNEPEIGSWVHTLEHGRILFQYAKGTPQTDVDKLIALAQEKLKGSAGYHTLVFQNNTNMPAKYAAVAWTKSLTCNRLTAASIAAMRKFREAFTDKAPELVP